MLTLELTMPTNEKFITFTKNGEKCSPTESTFPILKQMDNDSWQLIGTGFFITRNGIFLTAKHVLEDVLDDNRQQTHPIAAFLFPSKGTYHIRPIHKGFLSEKGDMAAGIITNPRDSGELLKNPFYCLNRKQMNTGDKIFTFAYPKTIHSGNNIIFHPEFYEGKIEQHYPNGRDKTMLPNPCYQTTMNILGGASGGPVFNSDGAVIGINSTGYDLQETLPISYISNISPASNIILRDINTSSGYQQECTIETLFKLDLVPYY